MWELASAFPQEETALRVRPIVHDGFHRALFRDVDHVFGNATGEQAPSQNGAVDPVPDNGAAIHDDESVEAERPQIRKSSGKAAARDDGKGDARRGALREGAPVFFGDIV